MATSKGVIRGYTGVATVDAAHQIIVDAQAHGVGAEQELLLPAVDATRALRQPETMITADAGYHSEANLRALADAEISALIADKDMRRRDARFASQDRYTALPHALLDQSKPARKPLAVFGPDDFQYDPVARPCMCPAGKSLYRRGAARVTHDHVGAHFRGAKRDCGPCARSAQYAQRFAVVEPVFANRRANKRLDRFTWRGRGKVDTQWKLYCLVYNIEKLAHAGYAA
nr:transposase [Gemmatimonas aurantiaca]